MESLSIDGYERLHDEIMDQISVSIYSDYEESTESQPSVIQAENQAEKKLKISLSQEQLKLNGNSKKFLTVPVNVKKTRSASFSIADYGTAAAMRNSRTEGSAIKLSNSLPITEHVNPSISIDAVQREQNEVIYAVPHKTVPQPTTSQSDVKASSASIVSIKSFANLRTDNEVDFKHPLAFYCKICNKILDDPRVLDCLHSFCFQCLLQLDASSDLQNNQFWRKISDDSSCKYEWFGKGFVWIIEVFCWKKKIAFKF